MSEHNLPVPPKSAIAQRLIGLGYLLLVGVVAFLIGRYWHGAMPTEDTAQHAHGTPDGSSEGAVEAPAAAQTFLCPMHPQVRQDEPGICPICFMDLVVAANDGDNDPNVVPLTDRTRALAGVVLHTVARGSTEQTLQVVGRAITPSTGRTAVTAPAMGRVDRVWVQSPGEDVRRGARVAQLFVPEIVEAAAQLRDATERGQREARSDVDASLASAPLAQAHNARIDAARQRLQTLGVPQRTIDRMATGEDDGTATIVTAPAGGVLLERGVQVGAWVDRGMTLASLQALDPAWVQLDIYEADVSRVGAGTAVTLQPRGGGPPIVGTIDTIEPVVDGMRRLAQARVAVADPDGRLRPGSWVDATIGETSAVPAGNTVRIPRSAVLWTGPRSIVYALDPTADPPVLVPVEVTVGQMGRDTVEIVEGLFPGEQIVSEGAFRIDASLQIRGGRSMMQRTAPPASPTPAEDGHAH